MKKIAFLGVLSDTNAAIGLKTAEYEYIYGQQRLWIPKLPQKARKSTYNASWVRRPRKLVRSAQLTPNPVEAAQ